MTTIFIDGQAGTTGLEISNRLAQRSDIELLEIDSEARKSADARRALLRDADIAILCLPDDAAREAVALADGHTRILDASTAYRVDKTWAYGLPELCSQQRTTIANAQFVSNPGCYPQGFILLVRPLIEAGVLDRQTLLRCHAISGYSGGGRQMIEAQQAYDTATSDRLNVQAYGLNLQHKHVPEMHRYSNTASAPIFTPSVAHYYKGMLVQVPLFSQELAGLNVRQVHELLAATYEGEPFVQVLPWDSAQMLEGGYLNPTACNDSNRLELMVFGNDEQILLAARYDNLGKGASGAAVQNLNLMMGLDESTGL